MILFLVKSDCVFVPRDSAMASNSSGKINSARETMEGGVIKHISSIPTIKIHYPIYTESYAI